MKKYIIFLGLLVGATTMFAQMEPGSIRGEVLDDKTKEPIVFANIMLYQDGLLVIGAACDLEGQFQINQIDLGTYDLHVSLLGYETKVIEGVTIKAEKITFVDSYLKEDGALICCCFSQPVFEKPLFELDNASTGFTFSRSDIQNSPLRW